MKLFELKGITADQLTPHNTADREELKQRVYKNLKDLDEVGSGCFATAYSSKHDPGTIKKVVASRGELEEDSYFRYVMMLAKNDRMQSNKFFPKIFNVQVCKTPDELRGSTKENPRYRYDFSVDMERLQPFDKLHDRQALMIGKQLFHNFEKLSEVEMLTRVRDAIDIRGEKKVKPKTKAWKESLLALISSAIGLAQDQREDKSVNLTAAIKDKDFKKAVILLRGMRRKAHKEGSHRIYSDIHSGNIMFRMGPIGPQLVFNDPVS